jgi:hypothetical protein
MKRKFLLLWLLLPVPVIALHYGPGQRWLTRDDAGRLIVKARAAESRGSFSEAAACYLEAASKLGHDDGPAMTRCQIAAARARVADGDATDALEKMDAILDAKDFELQPADVQREARDLYASTSYYSAWVMRLEGAPHDEWSAIAEDARQQLRMIAESKSSSDGDAPDKNLEAAVRLERMSLSELMAKPLPKSCQSMCNKSLSKKMNKRCESKCNKPGVKPGQQPKDIRNDPKKSRGLSEYQEGMGS